MGGGDLLHVLIEYDPFPEAFTTPSRATCGGDGTEVIKASCAGDSFWFLALLTQISGHIHSFVEFIGPIFIIILRPFIHNPEDTRHFDDDIPAEVCYC